MAEAAREEVEVEEKEEEEEEKEDVEEKEEEAPTGSSPEGCSSPLELPEALPTAPAPL